jgi:hypothetical protein
MGWPPQVGELLPRAEEAFGVHYKLATYSLAVDHSVGGPKAKGFTEILGISLESIEYLEGVIHAEITRAPIKATHQNQPHGIHCVVEFPVRGIGERSGVIARLRTVWMSNPQVPPRLVSAYLKP